MSHRLRYLPEGSGLVEITVRCSQRRLLLRPSPALREIFIGVLARAQELYPVRMHAFCCLGNHYHLLLSGDSSKQISEYMRHVNTNLSKEAGRLHDWEGPLFEGRHRRIPVSEEPQAQIARLRYVLSQGTKEDLVGRPTDWPGAHSTEALLEGTSLHGVWYDRSREYAARQRGKAVDPEAFATRYELHLEPLPCWRDVSPRAVQQYVREMVEEIEAETAARHRREGTEPMGAEAVQRQHPHQRPSKSKRSPAPLFHAATQRVRRALIDAYRAFVAAFRQAAERLKAGELGVAFPRGSFPPPRPFVQAEAAPG